MIVVKGWCGFSAYESSIPRPQLVTAYARPRASGSGSRSSADNTKRNGRFLAALGFTGFEVMMIKKNRYSAARTMIA